MPGSGMPACRLWSKHLRRTHGQGRARTELEGARLALGDELGQGGRRVSAPAAATATERRAEGSRVRSGSEGRHLLFYFFYSLYFSEGLPWEPKVV